MQLQEPFADDQPQPEKQRVGGLAQVFVQAGDGLDVSFLDDVGCVDPPVEPAVEAQLDHPPQPHPVLGKNLVQGRLVPGTGLFQKAGCVGGVVVHHGPRRILTPDRAVYWTG